MVDAYAKEKENSTTSSTPYNMHEEKMKKKPKGPNVRNYFGAKERPVRKI